MWEFSPDAVVAWGTLITGLGTLLLAVFALLAMNAWKAEVKGTRNYDLAQRLLVKMIACVMGFFRLRHRFSQERLEAFNRQVDELSGLVLEGFVLWGGTYTLVNDKWLFLSNDLNQIQKPEDATHDLFKRLMNLTSEMAKCLGPHIRKRSIRDKIEQKYREALRLPKEEAERAQ